MTTIKVYSESLEQEVDMELSIFNYICKMQDLYAELCDLTFNKKISKNDPVVRKLSDEADRINRILNSKAIYKEYKRVKWIKVK